MGKNITNRWRKRPFRGGSVMIWDCISCSGLMLIWLGYSKSSTLFSWYGAFRLLSVLVDRTLTSLKEFHKFEWYPKSPGRLFCIQAREVSPNRYRKGTWTMTEGSRKQSTLCDRLKIYLSLKNRFFNFPWKKARIYWRTYYLKTICKMKCL